MVRSEEVKNVEQALVCYVLHLTHTVHILFWFCHVMDEMRNVLSRNGCAHAYTTLNNHRNIAHVCLDFMLSLFKPFILHIPQELLK